MKTNLIISNGLYLKPLDEAVVIDAWYVAADDFDFTLADGFIDVFTGKLYGMNDDGRFVEGEETGRQTWKVSTYRKKRNGKNKRIDTIDKMHGPRWPEGVLVIFGNRAGRRRMAFSQKEMKEQDSYLPF